MTEIVTTIDAQKLRNTVEFIDSLAQEGLSEIAAISKLALLALETEKGNADVESLVIALRAIRSRAEQTWDSIGYEAETVGCNYGDKAMERIRDAMQAGTSRRAVGA
ncbi:conserved protein of unknown function [Ralstonia solanacearum CMR15]|nr:conserved protein of unknown function [Ralstonia solanacearum CMR15]